MSQGSSAGNEPTASVHTESLTPADAAGEETPYDRVPYRSQPFAQSRPERMATIALLLGVEAPPVDRCRVLELGCSTGGNIIPLAEAYPACEIVGIDASVRQIDEGRAIVRALELGNVRLQHRDILEVKPDLGTFDYIIVHGVFSWVPAPVRDRILSICSEHLSPGGVAYVSYNVYPGWKARSTLRDLMLYRVRGIADPHEKLRQARAVVEFLAQSVPTENNPFGQAMKNEAATLAAGDDHYVYHDHLEEVNEPIYFNEFAAMAAAKGLQYLGEADFAGMVSKTTMARLAAPVQTVLNTISAGTIDLEQYMDFLINRPFRQTLLVHASVTPDRRSPADRVAGMHVSSDTKAEGAVDVMTNDKAVFRNRISATTTSDPLVKAALLHLGEAWPRSVPFAELLAAARARLGPGPVVVEAGQTSPDARTFRETLLQLYVAKQLDLSVRPSPCAGGIPQRPLTSRYARLQADKSTAVTSLTHVPVRVNDLERHVLRHLDGRRDHAALLDVLCGMAGNGKLLIHEQGRPVTERQRLRQVLSQCLDTALRQLSNVSLLKQP